MLGSWSSDSDLLFRLTSQLLIKNTAIVREIALLMSVSVYYYPRAEISPILVGFKEKSTREMSMN